MAALVGQSEAAHRGRAAAARALSARRFVPKATDLWRRAGKSSIHFPAQTFVRTRKNRSATIFVVYERGGTARLSSRRTKGFFSTCSQPSATDSSFPSSRVEYLS
jgi:hypothetical protein